MSDRGTPITPESVSRYGYPHDDFCGDDPRDELEHLATGLPEAQAQGGAGGTTASTPPEHSEIRTMHRYGFRSGQWAALLTIAPAPDKSDCYVVRFPDGVTDYWVVNDPDGQYEFRPS